MRSKLKDNVIFFVWKTSCAVTHANSCKFDRYNKIIIFLTMILEYCDGAFGDCGFQLRKLFNK